MNFLRLVAGVSLFLAAGCAQEIQPPLSADQRASYKVTKVDVVVSDTAGIRWGAGEDLILADAGLSEASDSEKDTFLNSADAQTALRKKAQDILQAAISSEVIDALPGEQPLQVSVVIDEALTSSAGRVFLVGGVQGAGGGAQLFDLTTGQALSSPQRLIGVESGGGGLIGAIVEAASREPMIRIGERFGEVVVRWMTAEKPITLGTDEDYNRRPLPPLPQPDVAKSSGT